MSRDPVTLTRAEALRRRKEDEHKRRDGATRKRGLTSKPAATQARSERAPLSLTPASRGRFGRRYNAAATSAPYGRSHGRSLEMPQLSLPRLSFGPRWVSFLLLAACIGLLYGMYATDAYRVTQVSIYGNQRIRTDELEMAIAIWNQPSFVINPAQVEYNLLASYPELVSVDVQVGLPADISITVQERLPVIIWEQAGQVTWVDVQGYAFPPRGEAEGLAVVTAVDLPPVPPGADISQTIGARPFLSPELAQAITTLYPTMPEGASLVYDSRYGLGWQDPLGWQVYFGQSGEEMQLKLNVYLSMVEHLLNRNIQPVLISVEYPSAPFYRMQD